MQRNRIGRYFANPRTTEITQAARDFRWLRWLARPESKMLRTHLLEGLPLANAQLGERNAWRQKDKGGELRLQLRPANRKLYEEVASSIPPEAVRFPLYTVKELCATIREART